jgi:hypothetical protein
MCSLFTVAPQLLIHTSRATRKKPEYQTAAIKEKQPKAIQLLTTREVLVEGLGVAEDMVGVICKPLVGFVPKQPSKVRRCPEQHARKEMQCN